MNRRGRERRRLLLLPQVPGCGPRHWVSFQGRSFVKSGLGLQAAGLTASSLFSGLQEEASKARKGRGETRPLIPPPHPKEAPPVQNLQRFSVALSPWPRKGRQTERFRSHGAVLLCMLLATGAIYGRARGPGCS